MNGPIVVSLVAMELGIGTELAYRPCMVAKIVWEIPEKMTHAILIIVLVSIQSYIDLYDPLIIDFSQCLVDGVWSKWGNWSECSVTCGGGIQDRSRTCTPPRHNGQWCEGNNTDVRICGRRPCPG